MGSNEIDGETPLREHSGASGGSGGGQCDGKCCPDAEMCGGRFILFGNPWGPVDDSGGGGVDLAEKSS